MAPKNDKAPRPRKGANSKLAPPVPAGVVLKDLMKENWVVGTAIGQGGFGVIYGAKNVKDTSKEYPCVVKFEPHGSGPLFVERNFYLKVAKEADINNWVKSHGLTYLGLPRYLGSGSHEMKDANYRFLVTDRFSVDLWSKFNENSKLFPLTTVLRIAVQVINALEYIHSTGYAHMDVKASNLMLGLSKASQNNVYLIDFGLVTRATGKRDPKQAHNGTIEYLSRDAHDGIPSMRGDLEVLGFNMLHWLASSLPWEKVAVSNTKGKEVEVQKLKNNFMDDIASSIKNMKLDTNSADVLKEYLTYVKNLKQEETPDYDKLRSMLQKWLKKIGGTDKGALEFAVSKAGTSKGASSKKVASPKKVATPRAKAKATLREETPEEEDDEPAQQKPRKAASSKAKAKKVVVPQDSDDEQETQPKRLGRAKPKVCYNDDIFEDDAEDDVIDASPSPPKRKKLGRSVLAKMAANSAFSNGAAEQTDKIAPEPAIPKWKQCATAQASNVDRAGEYTRQTPDPKSKTTKKANGHK